MKFGSSRIKLSIQSSHAFFVCNQLFNFSSAQVLPLTNQECSKGKERTHFSNMQVPIQVPGNVSHLFLVGNRDDPWKSLQISRILSSIIFLASGNQQQEYMGAWRSFILHLPISFLSPLTNSPGHSFQQSQVILIQSSPWNFTHRTSSFIIPFLSLPLQVQPTVPVFKIEQEISSFLYHITCTYE